RRTRKIRRKSMKEEEVEENKSSAFVSSRSACICLVCISCSSCAFVYKACHTAHTYRVQRKPFEGHVSLPGVLLLESHLVNNPNRTRKTCRGARRRGPARQITIQTEHA